MKKIFLVLAAIFCVATVSAQSKFESSVKNAANTIASQKWAIGLRAGSTAQVEAECFYADKAYFEGLLGLSYIHNLGVDFTLLHNWNCCVWDWTPNAGQWFLDAGVGVNIGGHGKGLWCGVAGQAKFGIKFNNVPIRLAVDVTPVIGPWINYGYTVNVPKLDSNGVPELDSNGQPKFVKEVHGTKAGFNSWGLCGVAISATYCF